MKVGGLSMGSPRSLLASWAGASSSSSSTHDMIFKSIMKHDVDIRTNLYCCVVFSVVKAFAKKIVFPAFAKDDAHTVVRGVSQENIKPSVTVLSCTSCTTSGSAHMVKAIHGTLHYQEGLDDDDLRRDCRAADGEKAMRIRNDSVGPLDR